MQENAEHKKEELKSGMQVTIRKNKNQPIQKKNIVYSIAEGNDMVKDIIIARVPVNQ